MFRWSSVFSDVVGRKIMICSIRARKDVIGVFSVWIRLAELIEPITGGAKRLWNAERRRAVASRIYKRNVPVFEVYQVPEGRKMLGLRPGNPLSLGGSFPLDLGTITTSRINRQDLGEMLKSKWLILRGFPD